MLKSDVVRDDSNEKILSFSWDISQVEVYM